MRRALLLSFLALGVACKRDASSGPDATVTAEPKATAVTSASATASASATTSAVASSEIAAPPKSETKALEDLTPPGEGDSEHPLAKLGDVVVWTADEDSGTRIVARRGKDKPKLLRKTSGKARALAVIENGEDIAVAWVSELTQGGTQLVALVNAAKDLSKVSAPVTVAMVATPIQDIAHVALTKNPRGGVVVAHQGPTVPCSFMDHPSECLTFEVKAINAAGTVTTLAKEKLDGGPSPEFAFLDVDGKAFVVLASSMRGGRTQNGLALAYEPSDPKPAFKVPICWGNALYMPELVRGTAGEVASVCIDSRFDNPKCVRPLRGDADRCLRIAATSLDGKDLAPAVKGRTAAVQKVECGDGGAGVRLVLDGGGAIELATKDPAVADFAPRCAK